MQLGARRSDPNPPTASFLRSLGAAVGQVFLQCVLSDSMVAISLSTRSKSTGASPPLPSPYPRVPSARSPPRSSTTQHQVRRSQYVSE